MFIRSLFLAFVICLIYAGLFINMPKIAIAFIFILTVIMVYRIDVLNHKVYKLKRYARGAF